MPASVPSLYLFNYSPLLLPGSLARITHRRPSLFLIKLLWKHGKSRRGRTWGIGCMQSKILNGSVYSALWLGGLRYQYRRQTNRPLAARCPCIIVQLAKKKKKTFCRPLKYVGPPRKCPVWPDYQSSPACVLFWCFGTHSLQIIH